MWYVTELFTQVVLCLIVDKLDFFLGPQRLHYFMTSIWIKLIK